MDIVTNNIRNNDGNNHNNSSNNNNSNNNNNNNNNNNKNNNKANNTKIKVYPEIINNDGNLKFQYNKSTGTVDFEVDKDNIIFLICYIII